MLVDTLYVMLNLLFLMLGLVTIGEPLRILIAHFLGLFKRLDILQILVVNVYLGSLIIYGIAIVPLRLFTPAVLWAVLFFSMVFAGFYHLKELLSSKAKMRASSGIFCTVTIFVIFLIVLWIGVVPTTNFLFGSVQDSSLFSLFAKVILENHQIPETLEPYSPEGIIYPQGFFTVVAFAHVLLKMPLAEILLRITPLFQALIVPSAYYLGRELSGRKLGFSLAFVFAFVSRWPRLLVWGSNAFVAGFPLFLICLSLMPSVSGLDSSNKKGKKRAALFGIGLLYGYLAAIHLTLCAVLIFAIVLIGLVRLLRSDHKRTHTCSMFKNFLIVLVPTLSIISPFVFRGIMWYQYPGHNVGIPDDIVIAPYPPFDVIDWMFVSEGISPYPVLTIATITLIVAASITILTSWNKLEAHGMKNIVEVALGLIWGALAQSLLCMVQYAYPSVGLFTGEFARPSILLLISLLFFLGVFNEILWHNFGRFIGSKHLQVFKKKSLLVDLGAAMIIVQVFLPIYAPFLYYMFAHDLEYMNGQYNMFCVTTRDDLQVMQWMSDHLPSDSIVLINPFEAGGFMPVVSRITGVIYPFTASRNSRAYQTLTTLIGLNALNATTYQLIEEFDTDYIFIGSLVMAGGTKWDAKMFLGNPNFRIAKKVGNSYLVEVLSTSPGLTFRDDFEYDTPIEGGWVYYVPKECEGNGTGQAKISQEDAKHGLSSLMMTANKTSGFYYANWVYRKVYLPTTANVTLSFYINASCSSLNDFMSIIISDETWTNKVYFATRKIHPSENTVKLPALQGFFAFNLSQIWHERFNSNLPNSIYLEIQIADFDGIRDSCFVDYVTVSVNC